MLNSHSKKEIVVVGDKFLAFADKPTSICYSKLKNHVKNDNIYLRLGQGLSQDEINSLNNRAFRNKIKLRLYPIERCDKALVHKKLVKNVLISLPQQINASEYSCHLLADDDCDEMNDHVTGQHMQGMLLVEASRQMANAVTEKYLLSDDMNNKGFVLESMQVDFLQYVFPVETKIKMIIDNTSIKGKKNIKINCTFQIIQNQQTKCVLKMAYSLYPKDYLNKIEACMAALETKQLIKQG